MYIYEYIHIYFYVHKPGALIQNQIFSIVSCVQNNGLFVAVVEFERLPLSFDVHVQGFSLGGVGGDRRFSTTRKF
jgi:hypothetical protein